MQRSISPHKSFMRHTANNSAAPLIITCDAAVGHSSDDAKQISARSGAIPTRVSTSGGIALRAVPLSFIACAAATPAIVRRQRCVAAATSRNIVEAGITAWLEVALPYTAQVGASP